MITTTSSQRQCFTTQPRWNVAIDGPAPTCLTPSWQQTPGFRRGAPGASTGTATMADCMDPGRRPVVMTCPYPIKSGDRFSRYSDREQAQRQQFDDKYGQPSR